MQSGNFLVKNAEEYLAQRGGGAENELIKTYPWFIILSMSERETEEIFKAENKLFADRIKKIVEKEKLEHPDLSLNTAMLFLCSKKDLPSHLAFITVFQEESMLENWSFKIPEGFDYPVYSLGLRPEDYEGDLVPANAEILDPDDIMWVDRNGFMCEYQYTYFFTKQGKAVLINHGYDQSSPFDEDYIRLGSISYMINLDVMKRDFPSRELEFNDYEKVGLVLTQIETGWFYYSHLPKLSAQMEI